MADTLLTPGEIRALLRESALVLKPGETLIIQVPWGTPPRTIGELGRVIHEQVKETGAGFHTLVIPAESIGAGRAPETTHACPRKGSDGIMSCCGKFPAEVPVTHRITLDAAQVTCGRPA